MQYLLGCPSILLWYPRNIHTFIPSIGSWCVIINFSIIHIMNTALLKSDVSGHFKAYSSHSFQPTGIGLGSLWRGNRCACRKVFGKTIDCCCFLRIFKVVYFAQNIFSKHDLMFCYIIFSKMYDNFFYLSPYNPLNNK